MSDTTPAAGEPGAEQWSARYEQADTPWDLGRAHPLLTDALTSDPGLGGEVGRALVPGCGRGHDAVALADAGWQVVAIDLAPATEAIVAPLLAARGGRFVLGDALAHAEAERFDLVFDHTLFCAIPPRRRPEFGDLCDRVLGPDGQVVSIVFPIGRDHAEGGPPWGMRVADVSAALGDGFDLAEAAAPTELPGRAWPHRWARWRRTS